ncbi:hypothetical protein GWK10_07170 [Spongiivirga citrea]|uniref:DUF4064 domain-containing protein n=2 Tax=Spongiivirga citrea TaxID=1481457 RepID=A0A6M0CGN6_9FLAO|nr:hypothetical protein [Spongiivirga citrea]
MSKMNNLDIYRTLLTVKGILTLCFSLFFVFYMFMGGVFGTAFMLDPTQDDIPFNPGLIFIIIGGIGFILTVTLGILTLYAAKYLGKRTNYTYIFVVSILNCLTGALGIVLGVLTLVELNKPEVKRLFDDQSGLVPTKNPY